MPVRIPVERIREWLKVLGSVERFAARLVEKLGPVTIILYGSYARGDFNQWSDVDLVVVSDKFSGIRVLDRYKLIEDLVEPLIQPVLLAPEELREVLSRSAWKYAFQEACVIVVDGYRLRRLVEEKTGCHPRMLEELRERVASLLRETVLPA